MIINNYVDSLDRFTVNAEDFAYSTRALLAEVALSLSLDMVFGSVNSFSQ